MRFLLRSFVIVLMTSFCVQAKDLHQKYVGQSGCAPDFGSASNHYGIWLDKSQGTRLEAHVFENGTILAIVHYDGDADRCGTVRDVVQSHPKEDFVWECVDKRDPAEVVVGTWPAKQSNASGPAIAAWRIDLKEMKFIRLNAHVTCDSGNYAGEDEGGDLATWARKRAGKSQP